jgi:hypothetical protein
VGNWKHSRAPKPHHHHHQAAPAAAAPRPRPPGSRFVVSRFSFLVCPSLLVSHSHSRTCTHSLLTHSLHGSRSLAASLPCRATGCLSAAAHYPLPTTCLHPSAPHFAARPPCLACLPACLRVLAASCCCCCYTNSPLPLPPTANPPKPYPLPASHPESVASAARIPSHSTQTPEHARSDARPSPACSSLPCLVVPASFPRPSPASHLLRGTAASHSMRSW